MQYRISRRRGSRDSPLGRLIPQQRFCSARAIEHADGPDVGEGICGRVRQQRCESALGRHFAPEFLNRFDAIVFFNPLSRETLREIAANMLSRLPVPVTATPAAIDVLVEAGYDQAMGARPLRCAIQSLVVDPLTDMIIRRQIAKGTPVEVDAQDGTLVLSAAADGAGAEAPEKEGA
ncbi:MAG TPA: hypothetical protein DCP20_06055 [Coriobacteriia bacterium]|nr:MAG: ATPase AAA-2 domain protein [Actinobacteria bacterium 66_15]HAL30262.1 hypothetical protein [Coriobacteriia bacterium]